MSFSPNKTTRCSLYSRLHGNPSSLPGGDNEREGQEEGHSGRVVEPEYARVYRHLVGLHQALQALEYGQHCDQAYSILLKMLDAAPKLVGWNLESGMGPR